jgi:tetratricopeptide (TPR) repeat protein
VRIDTYQAVKRGWLERQAEARQIHQTQLEESAVQQVQAAAQQSKAVFLRQIKWLLVGGVIALVLIVGLIILFNHIRSQRQLALQTAQQRAASCQAAKDLVCARESFAEVLRLDPASSQARSQLVAVHLEIAQIYLKDGSTPLALSEMEAALALKPGDPVLLNEVNETRLLVAGAYENLAQWEEAIFQLEKVLNVRPGDQALLQRIIFDYDRWVAQLRSQKRWLRAMQIENLKKDRYPTGEGKDRQ